MLSKVLETSTGKRRRNDSMGIFGTITGELKGTLSVMDLMDIPSFFIHFYRHTGESFEGKLGTNQ